MKLLEDRIREDGVVKNGDVLKVDSFLNHQMDVKLFIEMAREWQRHFADKPINKILTIEASGIGIAAIVGEIFGAPVVFAKKSQSINLDGTVYCTSIQSFTHGRTFDVIVSKKFIGEDDHVLIIDDFMANGCAMTGLIEICKYAGATIEGIGIAIEKGLPARRRQPARAGLRRALARHRRRDGSRNRRDHLPVGTPPPRGQLPRAGRKPSSTHFWTISAAASPRNVQKHS